MKRGYILVAELDIHILGANTKNRYVELERYDEIVVVRTIDEIIVSIIVVTWQLFIREFIRRV